MNTCTRLLLLLLVTPPAAAAIPVEIDLLPGEPQNIVDLDAEAAVSVALLGSRDFDAKSVIPESLRLAGASIVKDDGGRTDLLEDVNADGFLDRIVWFSPRELRLGTMDRRVTLVGKTAGGDALEGGDSLRTLASILSPGPGSLEEEKLAPVRVRVISLPDPRGVAVLGSTKLDPHDLVLGTVRVDGEPVAKGVSGEVVEYRDVDGDGNEDAVLWPRKAAGSDEHRFEGMTARGRIVRSEEATVPAPPPEEEAPLSGTPKSLFPFGISIPDVSPAALYPATIQVSGASGAVTRVRVVLNGIQHTCLNDLDVMLVAPSGQSVVLMSDVGGCSGVSSPTWLTFDDYAQDTLSPAATPSGRVTIRPVNSGVGDPFPAPAPAPSGATGLSAFHGTAPNGGWKLYVVDDAGGDTGAIGGGWSLDLLTSTQVCSTSPIAIPASGPASLYPSTATLAGLPPHVGKVSVTLNGLQHLNAEDLDVMLVDPNGLAVMLMSDAVGPLPLTLWQLTFDDDTWDYLPEEALIFNSAYRPANHGQGDDPFPAPAPQVSTYPDLVRFRGRDPNGTWRLYVVDDAAGSGGAISGGWCLDVTTLVPSESCKPFPLTIPEGAPANTAGPAFPYPVHMDVTGTSGVVERLQVRLVDLSHTYPDDLDIVLQAPSGRAMVLMSDVGGSADVADLDVTIDTAGPLPIPDEGPLGPGPYHPSDAEGVNPMPAGGPTSFVGSLQGEVPNGEWKLWVNDDAGADVGSMTGGWCMSLTLSEPVESYCTSPGINLTIPAVGTSGLATPYPWSLFIAQEGRIARRVRVRIEGLSHTYPDDLDVLLVGPQLRRAILMSDAGGSTDMVQQWVSFDDESQLQLPDDGMIVSDTYFPRNFEEIEVFPGVPWGIEYPELYGFQGLDIQGMWHLYVVDDAGQDVGSATRWCLDVFPLFPVGEVTNVRWYDKTVMWFDGASNAISYTAVRGTQAELASLLTGTPEGCLEPFDNGPVQVVGAAAVPPPGSFFWYLIVGTSGPNVPGYGSPGEARIGGVQTSRVLEPAGGYCP